MLDTRITHRKRIYGKYVGLIEPNHGSAWIEIEVLDEFLEKTSRGFTFQATRWKFNDGLDRNFKIKTIQMGGYEFDIPVYRRIRVKAGYEENTAFYNQESIVHFDNTKWNHYRKVHTKTVHSSDPPKGDPRYDENGNLIDDRSTLKVEVIDKIITRERKGFYYQRRRYKFVDQGDETAAQNKEDTTDEENEGHEIYVGPDTGAPWEQNNE